MESTFKKQELNSILSDNKDYSEERKKLIKEKLDEIKKREKKVEENHKKISLLL